MDQKEDAYIKGLTSALQVLAIVALDSEEKRGKAEKYIEGLAEKCLRSDLNPEQRARYLQGLASLGLSSDIARDS